MWVAFANAKATHIFSKKKKKKNSIYAIFNDQSFKDALTNDIISFEQLGLGVLCPFQRSYCQKSYWDNGRVTVKGSV